MWYHCLCLANAILHIKKHLVLRVDKVCNVCLWSQKLLSLPVMKTIHYVLVNSHVNTVNVQQLTYILCNII